MIIVTGSAGLIGSEASRFFHSQGFSIIGIDNDLRSYFFGKKASTSWNKNRLIEKLDNYSHFDIDIRNYESLEKIFRKYNTEIKGVIHTAAQPSHDWAAKEPITDFSINATGTLNLLELTHKYCSKAVFIYTSTNKVYGDSPNFLPVKENSKRWEIDNNHKFHNFGIDESMSIDNSKHSIFGASKAAADLMVQEYGKYFGMKTVTFRGGCLTGPAHSGAELHGFLSYLVLCAVNKKHYTIFGYKGKQVRDNIHSYDLINAFWHYYQKPTSGKVYNMGGSRFSNTSILEAIELIRELSGHKLDYSISDNTRSGDHIWYISDVRKFQKDYPTWNYKYNMRKIMEEMINAAEKQ